MHKTCMLSASIMVAGLIAYPALAADQCPPLKVMASVDMVALRNGVVMIPVTVAGQQKYFVLATGLPYTSINGELADQLAAPRRHSPIKFVGLDGQVSDTLAIVPSFGLGRLNAELVQMLVNKRQDDRVTPDGAARPSGALGADFLRAYDVDLDFGAKKLNLISREHCTGDVLYWKSEHAAKLPMSVMDNDRITFIMTLDGHDLQTVLSTEAPMSTINMRVAKNLYGVDNNSAGNKIEGHLGDGTTLYAHTFNALNVEGLAINNPKLVLMPNRAEEEMDRLRAGRRAPLLRRAGQQQPELVLGMAELRHLHVYIDYHNQAIYFTPAKPEGDVPNSGPATP